MAYPGEELEQTKRQVKGQIMLSLESTGARLYRLAGFALYEEPYLDLDQLLGAHRRRDLGRGGACSRRVLRPRIGSCCCGSVLKKRADQAVERKAPVTDSEVRSAPGGWTVRFRRLESNMD